MFQTFEVTALFNVRVRQRYLRVTSDDPRVRTNNNTLHWQGQCPTILP